MSIEAHILVSLHGNDEYEIGVVVFSALPRTGETLYAMWDQKAHGDTGQATLEVTNIAHRALLGIPKYGGIWIRARPINERELRKLEARYAAAQ